MRILAALLAVPFLCAGISAAQEEKRLIWGNIPFVKAGNYYEFDAELSNTRSEARNELLGELNALLIPLAYSADDLARLGQVVATTIMQFDALVRRNADEAHAGIPISLAEDFKAGIDRFYTERRLNDSEQQTGLAYVSHENLLALSRKVMPVPDALQLIHDLRFLAYGSYTVVDQGVVRAVITLEDVVTLRTKSFDAEGPLREVGGTLATQVMTFLQGVEYPSWQNPQPQLTWIAPAFPQAKVRAQVAALYCEGGVRARIRAGKTK